VFTFFPGVLSAIGKVFWLQRWADVLVYGSIIFTIYMTLLLLSKTEQNRHDTTRLVRELAIANSEKYSYRWNGVILVRVYNEAEVLLDTLNSVFDSGHTNILIIDDGSTDASAQIIEKFAKKHSHIISVRHSQNRGAWAALETWFEYVRRYLDVPCIITFDADGQHDIQEAELFKTAATKYPYLWVIFGSRFLKNSGYKNMPFFRKCILKGWRIFTYLISGAKLSDPHNGYRLIRTDILDRVRLSTDTMAYASELIELIKKHKISHAEIPVNIIYTDYSLSKWQKSSNAIFIMFHAIWSKFFK